MFSKNVCWIWYDWLGFNAVFNNFSVILRMPVHLLMHYLVFSHQYSTQQSSQATGCFLKTVSKEGIAQIEQFLLLPQCFPLLVIGYPFNYRDFQFLTKYVQSRLLQNCRMRERVKSLSVYPNIKHVKYIQN